MRELKPNLRHTKWKGVDLYWLYDYNDAFRSALFSLKGCGDYEMKDTAPPDPGRMEVYREMMDRELDCEVRIG